MAVKSSGSFANGQRIWNANVIADAAGMRGDFAVSTPSGYSIGDFVAVEVGGGRVATGVVEKMVVTPAATTVWWTDIGTVTTVPYLKGSLSTSIFSGMTSDEIIDMTSDEIIDIYARDMALKWPA